MADGGGGGGIGIFDCVLFNGGGGGGGGGGTKGAVVIVPIDIGGGGGGGILASQVTAAAAATGAEVGQGFGLGELLICGSTFLTSPSVRGGGAFADVGCRLGVFGDAAARLSSVTLEVVVLLGSLILGPGDDILLFRLWLLSARGILLPLLLPPPPPLVR